MDSGSLMQPGGNGNGNAGSQGALDLADPLSANAYLQFTPQELGPLDYWRILTKRKAVVLIAAAAVFILVAINTFRSTKQYQSVARVAVYRETPQVLDFKDGEPLDSEDWDYSVAIETQVRIMQSDSLALSVAKAMDFDRGFRPASPAGAMPAAATELTPQQEAALIGMVRGNLQVTAIPNTRMIELRYSNPDPRLAAQVLNTFIQQYIQENIRSRYDSTVQAGEWLSHQLADLRLKVESSQQKLVDYEKQNDILGLDEKQNIITAKLSDLNRQLTDASAARMQAEATYELTQHDSPELLTQADPNSLIEQLRTREASLKTQYAEAGTQFGPQYPKVKELANELAQVESNIQQETRRLGGRLQSQYLAAQAREKLLQGALDQQKRQANLLNERAIQYSLLKRDLDTNQQLYDSLLQRMKEASVSAALKSSNVRIVDMARVPTSPSAPNVPRDLGLGLAGGLLAGVVLGFAVELFDNTVRTPEQVQAISALPSLGVVPLGGPSRANRLSGDAALELGDGARVEVISHSHPKSEIAESYRALRTSILLSALGSPPQIILLTSALPQEGKTTTCVNCAVVLAQQGGRVLLVDADLRRPSVHQALGIRTSVGLSSLLAGQNAVEDVIVRSPQIPNLHVLPAGPAPPQPAELLGSDLMKHYLQAWRKQYDHIVIDTPPALSVTDAVVLSVQADSVVLVIRSGATSRDALRRARDLLRRVNARVTGVVVNAVDLRSPDLHHYYYAGSGYSPYGYSYYDDSTTQKRR